MKNTGKYLYIIPIAIFGLFHFVNAGQLTGYMPGWMPLKTALVYLTGLGLVAAAVALIINKKARLAMTLLAVELLSFALLIHLLHLVGGDEMAMGQLLKDTALAGAAFYIASHQQD